MKTNFKIVGRIFAEIVLTVFLLTGFDFCVKAQSVGINTTGEAPNGKAILDVSSTTQGFLPPRMTYAQRIAITNPPAGLIVWCSNCGPSGELQVYNGSVWTNMIGGTASMIPAIGQVFGGGIIAYILQPGDPGYVSGETHGLIAAATDQSAGVHWGCYPTLISGADGTELGSGNQNTLDIVVGCGTAGIAARICSDLERNGYSDWFLPSKDELDKLYINKVAIGGFTSDSYWSSSEYNDGYAWKQDFSSGDHYSYPKDGTAYVRAVRAF